MILSKSLEEVIKTVQLLNAREMVKEVEEEQEDVKNALDVLKAEDSDISEKVEENFELDDETVEDLLPVVEQELDMPAYVLEQSAYSVNVGYGGEPIVSYYEKIMGASSNDEYTEATFNLQMMKYEHEMVVAAQEIANMQQGIGGKQTDLWADKIFDGKTKRVKADMELFSQGLWYLINQPNVKIIFN